MHYADRTSLIRGRTFATGNGDRNVLWGCFNAPFRELMEARVSAGGAALYAPANDVVAFTKCVTNCCVILNAVIRWVSTVIAECVSTCPGRCSAKSSSGLTIT